MSSRSARRVSIVIPCFNHARYLTDAIDSALAQSWPRCEVIVVNDGSTDDTAAVAASYPAVRLITRPNRGLSAARNTGLDASSGDYVIFLDADDRLWPNAAEVAVRLLDEQPEAAMVYGRCRLIDGTGQPLATNLYTAHADFYEELLRGNFIWMPGMAAFRREVFDEVGVFDVSVSPAADYDMYLRISRHRTFAVHDAIVADYRQHGSNMSADPVLMLNATLTVLRRQREHARRDPYLRAAYHAGFAHWRMFYGERLVVRFRSALHARRFGAAAADAWHLLRMYPAGVRRHLLKKTLLSLRGASDTGSGNGVADPSRL